MTCNDCPVIGCWYLSADALSGCRPVPQAAACEGAACLCATGKLHTSDLTAALCRDMHLPAFQIPERRYRRFRAGRVALCPGTERLAGRWVPHHRRIATRLVLHIDTDKLAGCCRVVPTTPVRVFTGPGGSRRHRPPGEDTGGCSFPSLLTMNIAIIAPIVIPWSC